MSPTDAQALFLRGNSLLVARRFPEALASFEKALRIRPAHPETLANMGVACAEMGKFDEALAWYDAAIAARPQYPEAHFNRGNALCGKKCYAASLKAYDLALEFDPKFARAWNNRGMVLMRLGRPGEAATSYAQALTLKPSFAEPRNNYGLAMQIMGKVDDALQNFDECLVFHPNFAAAHVNRAQVRLLKGDFERGWPEYESRCQMPQFTRYLRDLPFWDGSPLAGRTILLRHEQGLGDTLQFVRYAELIKQQGGRVILECQPQLKSLLASFAALDGLIERGTPAPSCDCQANLLSLPGLFHTRLETIPCRVPYVAATPGRVARWREHLPRDRFLIGISWQGSPDYPEDLFRSIPLKEFAPLAALPGVQLVSLQKGLGVEQIAAFRAQHSLLELGDDFDADKRFLDTAAVMASLDLVVSSDTSIAHLAGALGRPAWIALPVCPDWRWLLKRTDSPWYPTLRLFRQPTLWDWGSVFKEIATELSQRGN